MQSINTNKQLLTCIFNISLKQSFSILIILSAGVVHDGLFNVMTNSSIRPINFFIEIKIIRAHRQPSACFYVNTFSALKMFTNVWIGQNNHCINSPGEQCYFLDHSFPIKSTTACGI